MMPPAADALLCVANFPANTGYAWDFIEGLYARVASHLATHGIRTIVAYPAIAHPPRTLAGSAAQAVVLDASLKTPASVRSTVDLIRSESVAVVYLTDRAAWSLSYLPLRWAGVRRILVHDHTSGERTTPRGVKWIAKWALARTPGIVADAVVTVSDYVARRQVDVGLIPSGRVVRIWNGLPAAPSWERPNRRAHGLCGSNAERTVIGCACRATPEKGVDHLFRAFDRLIANLNDRIPRPVLLYIGDGPQMAELRTLREGLAAGPDITLAGYRPDAADILGDADIWQDAFSLAVLEAMARGKAVIATRVGGIPELVEHEITGLLVPSADERALAEALARLLHDPAEIARLGAAARRRAHERFSPEAQILRLAALVEEGFFGSPCEPTRSGTGVALQGGTGKGRSSDLRRGLGT